MSHSRSWGAGRNATHVNWLVPVRKVAQPALRLFVFHYAGGSASFCNRWGAQLPTSVELISIQLPGREQRFAEPFITNMTVLVPAVAAALEGQLEIGFAMFGHSMGASVAFEVIQELRRRHGVEPRILFVSGRQAPQFADQEPPLHLLPDDDFCARFLQRHYSKHLETVLSDVEVRQVFLPQLRADLQLIENYRFQSSFARRLACPVIAFDGEDPREQVGDRELTGWAEHTSSYFRWHRFPGGHFFIDNAEKRVLATLRAELAPLLS
jgi:medium-chain acyl-[acyl-carrier-protein] hydrolase